MFSGLVEGKARLVQLAEEEAGIRLVIERPSLFDDVRLGDSVAIQGCCLTVVEVDDQRLSFQAGRETLSRTSLGSRKAGQWLNVERALALGDRLGGHLVSGHIDGQAELRGRVDEAEWSTMRFTAPSELMRQMASKGSITIDGVSLTLVEVSQTEFSVALIPHTLNNTTLGSLQVGELVNIETDLLAKYVQRQLAFITS